ncbi:unnamed protein product, partial [Meganyctiphanes norvegica]
MGWTMEKCFSGVLSCIMVLSMVGVTVGTKDLVLQIGGTFPINGTGGWQGGQACQPSAMMALEDVNNRPDLIPGYRLSLAWNDSLCEPGLGAAVLYDMIYNPPPKLMLLVGCSTVSTTIGEVAKNWDLVVLSYGSSSPALSDRKRFSTFFRTHPSATVHNPIRVKLFQKFGWSRIAILQQTEEVFISTTKDLEKHCKDQNIEIMTRQSFLTDPTDAIRNIKRQDARIVVALSYVVSARKVLCEIYKNKLYGKSYVWFFIGWYEDGWYEHNLKEEGLNCTASEMREAAEGHLTTEALMWNQDKQKTISGMTTDEYRDRLNSRLKLQNDRYPEGYQEAPLAYDAVWAIALALNKTMMLLGKKNKSIDEFVYNNKEISGLLYDTMRATEFRGVSGRVAFSTEGDRIAWTQVEQLKDGKYHLLGYFDVHTDNLTWVGEEKWVGDKPPPDRTIIRKHLRTVSLGLFISMCTICAVGALWAIILLIFNVMNRHRRFLQQSHIPCNNLVLIGIIFCLFSVFLLGLDGNFVPEDQFTHMCSARAWILSIGFSLSYGSMFSKIWRVHRHVSKTRKENKRVEPWKLYLMVTCFVVIDLIILTVWQIIDPLKRILQKFPLETPPNTVEDIKLMPELEHCESSYNKVWLGVLYGYKGILLIAGICLAYETRSVKLKQINDSRLIGMSIYNVVVLCIIAAPVSMVIVSQQDAAFTFVALAIIFCTYLSMALIFIPKIVEIWNNPLEALHAHDTATKEEEEKYQKLCRENEDIQRLISEKEEKIRLLKRQMSERATMRARVEAMEENHVNGSDVPQPQMRLRQGGGRNSVSGRPAVRIVTPEAITADAQVARINFDISESYL